MKHPSRIHGSVAPSRANLADQILKLRLLVTITLVAGAIHSASAFTNSDANTLINAYNAAFFVDQGSSGYYKDSTATSSATWFWGQAEEIEMLIDAYERTGSSTYKSMITKLCNGFINTNGTSWTWNEFNDDIAWACIAFVRAYQNTGNSTFLSYARSNFDAMYSRAWDSPGGGGLWWTTAKTSKNTCVNCPAGIVAYLIYQANGDSNYLNKANSIFTWAKANVYNSTTGKVYDSPSNQTPTTYNQGTFIGLANFLGDVNNGTLAANYVRNSMGGSFTPDGYRILPQYDPTTDGGGFNGIFMRWMTRFMGDRDLQSTFLPWLQANAQSAWDHRRTSDNLSWCKWGVNTDNSTMDSFGCMPSVVALQVVPAHSISDAQYAVINRKSGKALHVNGGGTANGTSLIQITYSTSTNMRWATESLGGGQYRLRKVTNTRYATVSGASLLNDASVVINDWLNANQQKFTLTGNHGYYYTPVFVHSGKAMTVYAGSMLDNAAIIQYTYNGGKNAQWQFRNP